MRSPFGSRWLLAAVVMGLFAAGDLAAQAVTTSAVAGRVTGEDGAPLAGAQVVVTHAETGTQRASLSREDGRYFFPGLRPGGPYRVEARMIGYAAEVVEGIRLGLGQTQTIDLAMSSEAVALEGIEVVADRGMRNRNGTATLVDERQIETAPSLGRDVADFARMTPQAYVENDDDDGPSISIAGQNNRYNSIFIDGAVNNDVFGLSAQGTNGGQTGSTPISLDAIEEFQIAISPFDVTQAGFTGGAINAVTRSGTNRFEGSVYMQHRNEGLAGLTPTNAGDAERTRLPEFTNTRMGFRLGGPVVENKLFFFLNGEMLRSETPQPFSDTYRGASVNRFDEIRSVLQSELGYDAGVYGDKASTLDDNKFLAKLDWNINGQHRLTARHSYSSSENVDAFRSGAFTVNYSNNSEVFPNTTNSTAIELNSAFGNGISNKLILGYTRVRDDRDIAGNPFPTVTIEDGDGEIRLGAEPFSTANILNQDIFTLTNNVSWFLGRHTLTFGTHNEFYSMANLFIPFNYGWYFYDSVDDFLQSVRAVNDPTLQPANSFVLRGYSVVGDRSKYGDDSENMGAFDAFQVGFYAQDEFDATDKLRLTAGVRVDIPKITTKPRYAPDVFDTTLPAVEQHHDLNGATPGKTPAAQLYIQPRVGFNYDVNGDGSTVVRGGLGIFTGRVPFVWPGSMFLNNGANTGILANFGPNEFRPDPANGLTLDRDPIPSGRLEIFEEDFRYPNVARTSVGVDHELPGGLLATLEAQYTKTLSNVIVTNVNLQPTNATLDGPDNRRIYFYGIRRGRINANASLIDDRYDAIHRVGSTSEGYTYDITAQLQKDFSESVSASLAYTYGDAYAVNDGTSSQVNSIWRYQEHVDGLNSIELSRSDFSIGHRVLGQFTYRKEFLDNLATTVSAIYTGESGRPFSYTIDNSDEMTGEPGARDFSLLYVPNSASELTFRPYTTRDGTIVTPDQQAQALDKFIDSNEYLSERRGGYAERNGDRAPFENVIDLRIAQEVFANLGGRRHKAEITLDIFNFSNLLNEAWGRRFINPGSYEVVRFEGFQNLATGDLTPVYTFRRGDIDSKEAIFDNLVSDFGTYSSRWQMQLGVRYTF